MDDRSPELALVEGTVSAVLYRNEEDGYTILHLDTAEGDEVAVVGILPGLSAGEGLTVTMTLREALSQFVARRCETLPVVDAEGRPCGTLHFADLLRQEMSHEGAS